MALVTGECSLRKVHELIGHRFSDRIRIYEAGGGSASSLPSGLLSNSDVTVVDIEQGQLERNGYASTKLLEDIQTQTFPTASFELVVCYNVIEHLDAPDKAIEQFSHALAAQVWRTHLKCRFR
jgi:hypothetical protein